MAGMPRISETQKKLGVGLALVALIVLAVGAAEYYPTASNQGYAPEQPIPFSHKLHAGDNKIPCLYCHSGAEKSRHATVPSVNVCMNCHTVVKTESPHIQKIQKAYAENQPIEWVRVHELPDYVYFPHKRHVAKGVACETCHGNVKAMERIEQHGALTMGWCMECHRGETTPRDVMARIHPELKPGERAPVAAVNCTTCHN
jgi:hypothetical protein